jgi:branched-chain amino acid transport system permease protein
MQDKAATHGEASAKSGGALSAVMRGRWLLAAAATALFVGWPLLYAPPFLLYIATLVLLASIGATSLHLVVRSGHVSLGQAAFMGIAGYASVLLVMRAGWPFHFAFLASVALAGVAGLAIGPVLLRMTGKYFVLVTFLFGEMVRLVFIEWVSLTGGSNGIFEIPPPYPLFKSPLAYYYLALGAAAVCIGICARILGSEIGRTIDSLREGEQLAACSGVPVLRFKAMIFAVACALIAVEGSLQSHFSHFISPLSFDIFNSLDFVIMNVIGGMNNLLGPILGAVFLVSLPEFLRQYVELQRVFYGIILILVMAFLPGGLVDAGALAASFARRLLERARGRP